MSISAFCVLYWLSNYGHWCPWCQAVNPRWLRHFERLLTKKHKCNGMVNSGYDEHLKYRSMKLWPLAFQWSWLPFLAGEKNRSLWACEVSTWKKMAYFIERRMTSCSALTPFQPNCELIPWENERECFTSISVLRCLNLQVQTIKDVPPEKCV